MAFPRRNFKRGIHPNQIEFDPSRALSTTGGNGELYRGKLHLKSYPDGSQFQYANVALKRLRWGTDDEDTRLDNIIDETYVWKRVIHPNVLRFLGLLTEDEDMYLVAPFAPHGSLPQYVAAHPDADRAMLLRQVSVGMAYLHEQNIIHGDVKGANVLVFDGPTAKICDFGLSKVFDGKQSTRPQYSLPWTSPERLRGEPRSYSSDVYAFGMTIYEILSDRIPFSTLAPGFVTLFHAVCMNEDRPPKDPSSSSTGISYALLWALAERCWHNEPDKRPFMNEARDFIRPAEALSSAENNSEGLLVLSMADYPRCENSVKGAPDLHRPVTGELREGVTEVVAWAMEGEQDAESMRAVKQPKLQRGRVPGGNFNFESIAHPLSQWHTGPRTTFVNTMGLRRVALPSRTLLQMEAKMDQLKIVGAVAVKHHELKNPRPVQPQNWNDATGFWANLVEAEVASKRSLVKMYYKKAGGEKAFLKDIGRLGDCIFGLPRVRAYCLKSSIPFIVLEAESTRPLRNYLLDLAAKDTVHVADRKIWNTIADVNTAANFISLYCQDISVSSVSAALDDARVDQDGRILLAPAWQGGQGLDVSGATELTRGMLKKILMDEHAFHRLSCISFTFGAESWKYMTREDVLKLKDGSRAAAHYSAHAGPASSSDIKKSYEAWTQCSCLNHRAVQPRLHQFVFPVGSKLVNQALHLGLPSPVKTAVVSLINVPDSAMVTQEHTGSNYQELEPLPPKFWALLLIADGSPDEGSTSPPEPPRTAAITVEVPDVPAPAPTILPDPVTAPKNSWMGRFKFSSSNSSSTVAVPPSPAGRAAPGAHKSQLTIMPNGSASNPSLITTPLTTSSNERPPTSAEVEQISRTFRSSASKTFVTSGKNMMSATERALVRMPLMPQMAPPAPPSLASVESYRSVGQSLNDRERGVNPIPTPPTPTTPAPAAAIFHIPVTVPKTSWMGRFKLSNSGSSSTVSTPLLPAVHVAPRAHESSLTIMSNGSTSDWSLITTSSNVRNSGLDSSHPSASEGASSSLRQYESVSIFSDLQGPSQQEDPANRPLQVNDLEVGSGGGMRRPGVQWTSGVDASPPPILSTRPPSWAQAPIVPLRASDRSSMVSNSIAIYGPDMASPASPIYTRFNNADVRSISTTATTGSGQSAAWTPAEKVDDSRRSRSNLVWDTASPRPRKVQPMRTDAKRMDGIPLELDENLRFLQPDVLA